MPPGWRELGADDCDGPPDCASWITLAVDFNQDGATVTGTVTSTFATSPNYAWTVESGTIEPRCRRRRGCPRESGRNDCSPSLDRRSRSCPRMPPRIEAEQPGSFARRSGGLDVRRPFHRPERIRGANTGPRGGQGSRPGTTGPADHLATTSRFGPVR